MRARLQWRLEVRTKRQEQGKLSSKNVEKERVYLHEVMLRISGTVHVLKELMAEGRATGKVEAQG